MLVISPLSDCKVLEPVMASPNTSATLHCPLHTSSTTRQHKNISWAVVKGGNENPIPSHPDISQIRNRLEVAGASLVISSVEFSQWYRCKYLVDQSQLCFDIRLQVKGEILNYRLVLPSSIVDDIVI